MKRHLKYISVIVTMIMLVWILSVNSIVFAAATNYVQNPGFETELSNWSLVQNGVTLDTSSDAHTESKALHYWAAGAFNFKASQAISDLPDGIYQLTAWTEGKGDANSFYIFAKDHGGSQMTANISDTGWGQWHQFTISNIVVTSGQCTIGVYCDANADNWGTIDDFQFTKIGDLVQNSGFEPDLSGWDVVQNGVVLDTTGDKHSGEKALHYWAGSDFNFSVTQTVYGLSDGTYQLSVWTQGGGGEKAFQLFAKDYGGSQMTASISDTGWCVWHQFTIDNIEVTNGQCTIGIYCDAISGNWGTIDDFQFTKLKGNKTVSSLKPITVTTTIGTAPVMPSVVTAVYNDSSEKSVNVIWDSIDPVSYQQIGSFEVHGAVTGMEYQATATVNVTYKNSDLNGDSNENIGDMAISAYYFGAKSGDFNWNTSKKADINNDGKVDLADLQLISEEVIKH